MDYSYIARNVKQVEKEMEEAAIRSGRPVPTLVAVTKSADNGEVEYLVRVCQIGEIGENRTQLFNERYNLFSDADRPKMHLIGSLQTNKVKTVMGKPALIQSVDSLHLAKEIQKQSAKNGIKTPVLLEVNSGREKNKGGCLPEEAEALAEEIGKLDALILKGIMTMGPKTEDPEEVRPCFRETHTLFLHLSQKGMLGENPILSMGMSHSFPVAIEEGATMVRVGRRLFQKDENTNI